MKKISCLLVSMMLLMMASVSVYAAGSITKAYARITAPQVGARPDNNGTMPSTASTYISKVEWLGNFDSNGCFKAGEAYTAKVHLCIKSGMDKVFRNTSSAEWKVNGIKATFKDVPMSIGRKCILEATFRRIGMDSKKITSADIKISMPVPGQKPSTDILLSGAPEVEVALFQWSGKFDEEGNFKSNASYTAQIALKVKDGCIGSFDVMNRDGNNFTLNGEKVHLYKSSTDYASIVYNLYLEPTVDYLDKSKMYTMEQADEYYPLYHPLTFNMAKEYMAAAEGDHSHVVLLSSSTQADFTDVFFGGTSKEEELRTQKVIVNIADKGSWRFMFFDLPNLQEVWFGENADVFSMLTALVNNKWNSIPDYSSSKGATTEKVAIYLPASKYPKGLVSIQEENRGDILWGKGIPVQLLKLKTYVYDGNIYNAMKAPETHCKRYCPGHDFSARVPAAHTVMRYETCQHNLLYYYSCKYCGECEHNPKHTFMDYDPKVKTHPAPHTFVTKNLSAKNYVGRNAKGEKVYMKTCYWCGINGREEVQNLTEAEYIRDYGQNREATLAQHKESMLRAWDNAYKNDALAETSVGNDCVGYFAVPEDDHGAKISAWAENETKWAMALQLIDKEVLGADYLKSTNRLQMASIAVRLTEQLSQKTIVPAAAGTYSDCDNIYALKAHAAGLMPEKGAGIFAPTAVVSREEMATAIYNSLQWVKNHSGIRYSPYTPDLDKYSDKSQISDWALKAMGFIHKFGIIKETSKATIEPLKACPIQDAVVAAYRGYFVDELGWYQCIRPDERGYAGSNGGWSNKYCRVQPGGDGARASLCTYENGDRYWVSEPWPGRGMKRERETLIPITDEFSGTTLLVPSQDFLPIKEL